jgi:dihydrodipicolinate synthase/N-acetylneuraminate lyase
MDISKIKGNIVPIPGMYNKDLSINLDFYSGFIEKKIADGDKIFYLAKSASEFKYMSQIERLDISRVIGRYADDERITVLGQPLGSGSILSEIEEAKKMSEYGISALVILPTIPVLSGKFFSSHYDKAGFSGEKHGNYYIEYMNEFANNSLKPLIFHDAPLSNNLGLPSKYLKEIMSIDKIEGIKAHSPDPSSINMIYRNFSDSKFCFDGFGKTMQFWSMHWGAKARHTCWSWFDSSTDQKFYNSMITKDYKSATEIIDLEWSLAMEIKKNGFAGYKEVMRLNNLIDNNLTRVPGLKVSKQDSRNLEKALVNYINSLKE